MSIDTGSAKLGIQDRWVNLVTFRLDQQLYALPIEPIRQIIEMITVTPVPQVKDFIEGVINFHGAPVPVVNLRRQLTLARVPLQLHTPIILVTIADRLVGLIVDEVLDVLNLPESQIVDPKLIMPEGSGEALVLEGLIQLNGKTVLCLDLDHLFAPQVASDIAAAADAIAKSLTVKIEKKEASNGKKPRAAARNAHKDAQPEISET